jgi:hypothetical protein
MQMNLESGVESAHESMIAVLVQAFNKRLNRCAYLMLINAAISLPWSM